MIHICFGIHDKDGLYSKYTGVAIASVLDNTEEKVCIHIIHDKSLSDDNKKRFEVLVTKYGQSICFHIVDLREDFSKLKAVNRITIGTLYRLLIPDLLPAAVDKAIYFDSDIVVYLNVQKLWVADCEDNYALAVRDFGALFFRQDLFDSGVLSINDYFNDGVMVLNLRRIRNEMKLYEKALTFFDKYADVLDSGTQHALNHIFKGNVGYMSFNYNVHVRFLRNKGNLIINKHVMLPREYSELMKEELSELNKDYIFHFAGISPSAAEYTMYDQLFFHYLLETPWGEPATLHSYYCSVTRMKERQIDAFIKVLKKSRSRNVAFWGASGLYTEYITSIIPCHNRTEEASFIIDNNKKLHGSTINGLNVYSPEALIGIERKPFVIVISKRYYEDIKKQLEMYGYKEGEDYLDGLVFLSEEEGGRFLL